MKRKRFKHDKPAGLSFSALHQLQASRAPLPTPTLDEILSNALIVLKAIFEDDWAGPIRTRDDSKDDDRIVVKVNE